MSDIYSPTSLTITFVPQSERLRPAYLADQMVYIVVTAFDGDGLPITDLVNLRMTFLRPDASKLVFGGDYISERFPGTYWLGLVPSHTNYGTWRVLARCDGPSPAETTEQFIVQSDGVVNPIAESTRVLTTSGDLVIATTEDEGIVG